MMDFSKIRRTEPPPIVHIGRQAFAQIQHNPVDLARYRQIRFSSRESQEICDHAIVDAFLNGCLKIVNPPISDALEEEVNRCTGEIYDAGGLEVRHDVGGQVGMQKQGMEKRRIHRYFEGRFQKGHELFPDPEVDSKDRLMVKFQKARWEAFQKHPGLNQPFVLPPEFAQYSDVYEEQYHGVLELSDTLSEILSRGLGLDADYLRDLMRLAHGPTILAPTQMLIDVEWDCLFKVKIGSHADQAPWTYHGASEEALCLWTPDGYRFMHSLGPRERLVQFGLIAMSMFGITACLHQVFVTEKLLRLAKENGGDYRRLSCTAFVHGDTLHNAGPVSTTRTEERQKLFPDMPAGCIQYWNLKETNLRITPISAHEQYCDKNEPPADWGIR